MHLSYYLENFVFFKNTLTDELYSSSMSASLKLTTEQLANETDIIFTTWNIDVEPNDDQVKVFRIDVPILLCLNQK